jgi:TolA-binding protein
MYKRMNILGRSAPVLRVVVALCVVASASCAYYNMLYNANEKYKSANKLSRAADGTVTRAQNSAYDGVIEKCQTMIGTYPDSRHVDDAMLLIARSLFEQDRFLEAASQCDSLEIRLPETELLNQVRFLKGQALAEESLYGESISVMTEFTETWPKDDLRPYAHYYLSTSYMSLGLEDDAVAHIAFLEQHHAKDQHTFDAQVQVARILSEKESYAKSRTVYEALNARRLPKAYRYDVWLGLAQVYHGLGEERAAINTVEDLLLLGGLKAEQRAPALLLKAECYTGIDSLGRAIETFTSVTKKYARGKFGAEAHFRLGEIYEDIDSLSLAQKSFESVPRAYASSEYATEAIKRTGSIGKLLKMLASEGDDSSEARSLRQFSMAELQLTQFDNAAEALVLYQQLLEEFPDTEYAPKAAYAITYIFHSKLGDVVKAREALEILVSRYPDTPQARHGTSLLTSPPATDAEVPATDDTDES